jgi:oleate hydratase
MSSSATDPGKRRACIVGGGIAGLASAVYLIREAGFDGSNIRIFDCEAVNGGALDGAGSVEQGYMIRGGRMHERHFVCTWDLLSQIPSLDRPEQSVKDEIFDFNREVVSCCHSRLLRAGRKLDVSSYGLSKHDSFDLLRLNMTPESLLEGKRIDDWFAAEFFDTVFWYLWATTFAFQRWSSLAEMRRYAIRFVHLLPGFNQLKGIMRTPFNQYDSVVLPIERWLGQRGVQFIRNTAVTDIDFEQDGEDRRAVGLKTLTVSHEGYVALDARDYLFVTLGSMVESAGIGDTSTPAPLLPEAAKGAWALWRRIAARDAGFGRPQVFANQVPASKWMSFTVTLRNPRFFEHMESFTGNRAGTGGLVTLTDSNWLMSVVLAHQPHFRNQPPGVFVFWGDGLLPDEPGNYVNKAMSQCSGQEILEELFAHLGVTKLMQPVLPELICLPCLMPYIGSQFMPRTKGDRPPVIPPGSRNFAFLGQFVELPRDCVFTVEYSVRTAQTAVFGLLGLEREVSPLYRGDYDAHVLLAALQALVR